MHIVANTRQQHLYFGEYSVNADLPCNTLMLAVLNVLTALIKHQQPCGLLCRHYNIGNILFEPILNVAAVVCFVFYFIYCAGGKKHHIYSADTFYN